ncbi:hypothetical protein [Mycoplasma buteonis]|uniref:hypothetical protein n=1 Tax=Mycoplasma buteonis TaxID=171280 RepID=UPI000565FFD4|nr:hypothetical protein [Mycoplasma buteonis]
MNSAIDSAIENLTIIQNYADKIVPWITVGIIFMFFFGLIMGFLAGKSWVITNIVFFVLILILCVIFRFGAEWLGKSIIDIAFSSEFINKVGPDILISFAAQTIPTFVLCFALIFVIIVQLIWGFILVLVRLIGIVKFVKKFQNKKSLLLKRGIASGISGILGVITVSSMAAPVVYAAESTSTTRFVKASAWLSSGSTAKVAPGLTREIIIILEKTKQHSNLFDKISNRGITSLDKSELQDLRNYVSEVGDFLFKEDNEISKMLITAIRSADIETEIKNVYSQFSNNSAEEFEKTIEHINNQFENLLVENNINPESPDASEKIADLINQKLKTETQEGQYSETYNEFKKISSEILTKYPDLKEFVIEISQRITNTLLKPENAKLVNSELIYQKIISK